METHEILSRNVKEQVIQCLKEKEASRAQHFSQQKLTDCAEQTPEKYIEFTANVSTSVDIATIQEDTAIKTWPCAICGKFFSRSSSLMLHQRRHTGEKPYTCGECGKSYCWASSLILHQRTHTGEKPYECVECGKIFRQTSSLLIHQRKHSGEKPYTCTVCGKNFRHSSSLIVHTRTHTGEKPFICDECGKRFSQSAHLMTHKKTHTGERQYKCDECGKCFTQSGNLITHKNLHTNAQTKLILGDIEPSERTTRKTHRTMVRLIEVSIPNDYYILRMERQKMLKDLELKSGENIVEVEDNSD